MRTHGWQGRPPTSDEEAVQRILDATDRCIRLTGARTSISDVANELGVSRATVYRYFEGTTELLRAAAVVGTQDFVISIGKHLAQVANPSDPAEIIIEGIVQTVTQLPNEPYLRLLLEEPTHTLLRSITSDDAARSGRAVLDAHSAVDWNAPGLGDRFDEMLEWSLRIVQSLIADGGEPQRTPEELRAFLWRWIGPSIRALQTGHG